MIDSRPHRISALAARVIALVAVDFVLLALLPEVAAAAWFRGLGAPPGDPAPVFLPWDISADGSIVVGVCDSTAFGEDLACRWTAESGFLRLGSLGGGEDPYSGAYGVSADGSVIVGASNSPSSGESNEAMRWTAEGGMTGLGDLPGGHFLSDAFAASADGSVIVGRSSSTLAPNYFGEAFRWTAETGMVGLGVSEPSDFHATLAFGVSSDGSVIVGTIRTLDGNQVFRWTEPEGMVILGDIPEAEYSSAWPAAVSAAGSVIAGTSDRFFRPKCFRWTSASGMVQLPRLPGWHDCYVMDLSSDGSVVVGSSSFVDDDVANIWDEAHGTRDLTEAMIGAGLEQEIEGWDFESAQAVAADNATIVGWGYNPQGEREAFLVNLGPPSILEVPALSKGALLTFAGLVACAALVGLRRRDRRVD